MIVSQRLEADSVSFERNGNGRDHDVCGMLKDMRHSESRSDGGGRFGGCHCLKDLEIDDVAPVRHPLVEQAAIVALHHLVTAREIVGDPARDVPQPVRGEPPAVAKASVDGDRIAITEPLDDHEVHCGEQGKVVAGKMPGSKLRAQPDLERILGARPSVPDSPQPVEPVD